MFRCMLCASRSVVAHRGQRSASGREGFPGDECSPINFMSFSVEPAETCRLSNLSNQNAWQPVHTSMVTCAPEWPSNAMEVISVPQPGHFIDKYCSWSPGAVPCEETEAEEFAEESVTPYPPPAIWMNIKRKELQNL